MNSRTAVYSYAILSFIVNVLRSVPFIILLIVMIPFTVMLIGTSHCERIGAQWDSCYP